MAYTSRCVQPRKIAMRWREYIDESHDAVVEYVAWLQSLPEEDLEEVQEAVEALRQLAATGELEEGADGDLGNTSVDPRVFELKWKFFGRHIRQYHAEPDSFPDLLLALHVHTKPVDTRNQAVWAVVKEDQGMQMTWAKLRYWAFLSSEGK